MANIGQVDHRDPHVAGHLPKTTGILFRGAGYGILHSLFHLRYNTLTLGKQHRKPRNKFPMITKDCAHLQMLAHIEYTRKR